MANQDLTTPFEVVLRNWTIPEAVLQDRTRAACNFHLTLSKAVSGHNNCNVYVRLHEQYRDEKQTYPYLGETFLLGSLSGNPGVFCIRRGFGMIKADMYYKLLSDATVTDEIGSFVPFQQYHEKDYYQQDPISLAKKFAHWCGRPPYKGQYVLEY